MKTTVFYHSADFDGEFCREIAHRFLPDAELVGWNFGDPHPAIPEGQIYVMDLPVDRLFGHDYSRMTSPPKLSDMQLLEAHNRITWIDHHASSIANHPELRGYRIDGVAACRLAWQWFTLSKKSWKEGDGATPPNPNRGFYTLPTDVQFKNREVSEPLAVRLAGEYDVWDKRDPRAELFQHGLRSRALGPDTWDILLSGPTEPEDGKQGLAEIYVDTLLDAGEALQFARANEYRDVITQQGFDLQFEGLTFLACNSHECDIRSQLFAAGIQPHHDALLGFTFTGKDWRVSMYRIDGREADILTIARRHGGGGHQGACGFHVPRLINLLPHQYC